MTTALLASEFWDGATARSLLPGLRAHGWEVVPIDIRDYLPNRASLLGRIGTRLRKRRRTAAFNRAILATAHDIAADVFLTVKGRDVSVATVRALRDRGIFCVNYYPDVFFNDVSISRVTDYDLVATTKSFHLPDLRRHVGDERLDFVHHGFSDEFHRLPPATHPKDVDVLYIGNGNPAKAAFIATIAEALPGVAFRIVGGGWRPPAHTRWPANVAFLPERSGAAYAREVTRAKIVLAFHNGGSDCTGYTDRVSTRSFEIPACGGFMLHVENDEVRSLYDVPGEIETFTTSDNCAAKIRYWLAHPEERASVAARGHARAVPAYGYAARGRELATLIEERLVNR